MTQACITCSHAALRDPHPAEELAMMIRRLVSSLKRHWPHAPQPGDLPGRAVDLLRKYDLLGCPMSGKIIPESVQRNVLPHEQLAGANVSQKELNRMCGCPPMPRTQASLKAP